MSQLFSATKVGELELQNRIVIAPMCQYSAEDGHTSNWHQIHYGSLAMSGAGLLIFEAVAVEPIGRISTGDLGLWDDETESALLRLVSNIRAWSPIRLGMQLGHAGRKASCHKPWEGGHKLQKSDGGWQTVAPSALSFAEQEETPESLGEAGLQRIKQAFIESAQRAVRSGIELIEIHAAHGYLLHQFLSPLSNQRQDQYGGSLENRLRFPLEVFAAVRAAIPPAIPIGVRLSATDWIDGGWDVEQSIVFCEQLELMGCDYLHVSSGGLSPLQNIVVEPGYQLQFARIIRQKVKIPVMGVGLITEPQQAENVLIQGDADLVALGRSMLYNPHWPWQAAAALDAKVQAPPQYLRSEPHGAKGTLVKP